MKVQTRYSFLTEYVSKVSKIVRSYLKINHNSGTYEITVKLKSKRVHDSEEYRTAVAAFEKALQEARKIIPVLILMFSIFSHGQKSLVQIEPDSIFFDLRVVEKGRHEIYLDSVFMPPTHTKYTIAALRAAGLRAKYPNTYIHIESPNSEPAGRLKIFVDESKLTGINTAVIDSLKERLIIVEGANDIQSETIGNLLSQVSYIRKTDSIKFAILENRINTLQTFIKDSITFAAAAHTHEEVIDYSLPLLKGFSHDTTGWLVDSENNSYYYEDEINNRYIVFDLNRDLLVGERYDITFDIQTNGAAMLDFWLYKDSDIESDDWVSGLISPVISYGTGSQVFSYTVGVLNRQSFGIRAKNNGDSFTISNIKIKKI